MVLMKLMMLLLLMRMMMLTAPGDCRLAQVDAVIVTENDSNAIKTTVLIPKD